MINSTWIALAVCLFLYQANAQAEEVIVDGKSTTELLSMPRSEAVCRVLLSRKGVSAPNRLGALAELARLNRSDELTQLLKAIDQLDSASGNGAADVLHDLTHLLSSRYADQLLTARNWLEKSAQRGRHSILRQAAFAALVTVDKSIEPAWQAAVKSPRALQDLIDATPLVSDMSSRTSMFPKVVELLNGSVNDLTANAGKEANDSIRRAAIQALPFFGGKEAESARILAQQMVEGRELEAAVRSLRQIPRAFWPKQASKAVLESLLNYLKDLPAGQRSTPAAVEAAQLCLELTLLLPPENGVQVRAVLDGLKIHAILLRPTPHHMTYDRSKVYVAAGKPVEIVFQNTDLVPHNLVITAPGTSAEVGQLVEALANQSATAIEIFVPESDKVLHATRMVSAGEFDTLRFIAPEVPAVYGIVCTYPGRWRTMYAALHVVSDLRNVPTAELFADAPIRAAPRAFVRDWKFDELAPNLAQVDRGRSFERGKYLYGALACAACHQWPGNFVPPAGVGPDLTDVHKRFKRGEILRDLLEPSKVINPKFQTQIIETGDGEIVTGIVVREDSAMIRLLKDPRETCEPKDIRLDNIEARLTSKISMMPIGPMTTLSKEEIFDLLAYLESGGEADAAMFKK